MMKLLLAAAATSLAFAGTFPTWAGNHASRRPLRGSPSPPLLGLPVTDSLGLRSLKGSLFYGTCNLPACSTLEFGERIKARRRLATSLSLVAPDGCGGREFCGLLTMRSRRGLLHIS